MKRRDLSIDILKGIGISLVLVAHSLGGVVSRFAYSFHMPLFFIVAGLFIATFKQGGAEGFGVWWRKRAAKDLRRLIIPALFTTLVILLVSSLWYAFPDSYLKEPVGLIWNAHPAKPVAYVKSLGNMWFLFALFFARQAFYGVQWLCSERVLPWACLVLGAAAVAVGRYAVLPFEMSTAISVLPFLWGGYYVQTHGGADQGVPRWFYASIAVWVIYLFCGNLRVDNMTYPWGYMPNMIAAAGGTLACYQLSKWIAANTKFVARCLAFLGTYSLILVCVPGIETYCFPMQEVVPQMPCRFAVILLGKVCWCVLAIFACLHVPLLKKIFVKS